MDIKNKNKLKLRNLYLLGICIFLICNIGILLNKSILQFMAGILIAFYILKNTTEYNIYLLMIIFPLNTIVSNNFNGLGLDTTDFILLIIIKLLIESYRKNHRYSRKLMIIGLLFFIFDFSHYLGNNTIRIDSKYLGLVGTWMLSIMIIGNKSLQIEAINLANMLLTGMMLNSMSGIILKNNQLSNTSELITSISTGNQNRFRGIMGDPNYYGAMILICIGSILLIGYILNKNKHRFIYSMLFFIFVGLGFLSYSKAYTIVIAILFVYIIVQLLTLRNKKVKKLITNISIIMILLFVFLGNDILELIGPALERLTLGISSGDLTTGRDVIYNKYINFIFSSNVQPLIGMGLSNYYIHSGVNATAHNIILEIMVAWGIIGIGIFITLLIYMYKCEKNKYLIKEKKTSLLYMPLIILLIVFQGLSMLNAFYFPIIVMYGIKMIFINNKLKRGVEYDANCK